MLTVREVAYIVAAVLFVIAAVVAFGKVKGIGAADGWALLALAAVAVALIPPRPTRP